MRKLPILALVAVACLTAATNTAATGARQTEVRCSPITGSLDVSAPARLAWGRSAVLSISGGGKYDVTHFWVSRNGTFAPVALGIIGDIKLRVEAKRPQPAIELVVRWRGVIVDDGQKVGSDCVITIPTGLGRLGTPEFLTRVGGIAIFSFAEEPEFADCQNGARVPATLLVRSGSVRRQLVVPDQCLPGRAQRSTSAPNWRLAAHPRGISFRAFGKRPKLQRFTFTLRLGPRKVSGKFIVRRSYFPPRTIWQETDDFVNVCINQLLRIWSSGGRLYCTEPAFLSISVHRT